ncbi:hypothetical protein HYH03_012829 [Edaphochlamys debaryana]|uniref:Protein kinase domain-containing protein n=1 Tax=Edaphochlamys debaryana TaxID=47281 RepID=A0A836BV45_9CHLO|nr:hypothetical protein HYH03_012829 [Edaphochlamys debaryana]|eukprot:KAG2488668.1 hypothetical protein HYH03_012829 [Edaphochlamys debaryana]
MASSLLHSHHRPSEPVHVLRHSAHKLKGAAACPITLQHDTHTHVGSPESECGWPEAGPRPSLDSNLSELSLASSVELAHLFVPPELIREEDPAPPLTPSPSLTSLVRQPLPEEHHKFIKKALRKLRPGQQLQARKVRPLGKGGVGEVHLLELDLPDGGRLHVAQKAIICRKYDAHRHARELAAMEATAACPFVLRVYGSTPHGKAPYALYTEYAPLGSLHDLIQERQRLGLGPGRGRAPYFEEDEVRWLSARVLAALAHVHGKGLVHRDVSPHNIYRSASGHPLLADFDAAQALDEDGLAYGPAGRLAIAAPEVRAAAYGGGAYGTKADMWSLGMVVLEMVSDKQLADGPRLEGCSEALRHLVLEGLLVQQARRLDAAGAMAHPFFAAVDWAQLEFEQPPPGLRPPEAGGCP